MTEEAGGRSVHDILPEDVCADSLNEEAGAFQAGRLEAGVERRIDDIADRSRRKIWRAREQRAAGGAIAGYTIKQGCAAGKKEAVSTVRDLRD